MTLLAVEPHPDMRGGSFAYPLHPARISGPLRTYSSVLGGRPWRPARHKALSQGGVQPGEPTSLQRYANVGIIAVGLFTAFLAWPHKKKFGGSIAFSAGSGAIGVGLAFLTLDLIGFRPGGGECL